MAAVLLTLAACGSSDSDPVTDADAGSQDTPGDLQTADTTIDDPLIDAIEEPVDGQIDDPVVDPIDDPVSDPIDDPVDETGSESVDTPASEPEEDPTSEPGEDPSVSTPPAAPGLEGDNEPVESESVEPGGDSIVVLDPQATPGSNLDRLFSGLTRQASITLLDLNQRISNGEMLTDLEEQCLGSFEEEIGAPLLAIDCGEDNFLATGDVQLSAGKASFFDTPECSAAIFDGNSEGCVLQELTLSISTRFVAPDDGGLPMPVFPGSLVDYAVDNTDLVIRNLPAAPTGLYSCNVDLETVSLEDDQIAINCNNIVEAVADELERLQGL